jgi:DNA-binding beta-propeller fold protein YncE
MALEEVTRIDLNSSEIEPIVSCVVDETNNVLYSLCALNTGWRTIVKIDLVTFTRTTSYKPPTATQIGALGIDSVNGFLYCIFGKSGTGLRYLSQISLSTFTQVQEYDFGNWSSSMYDILIDPANKFAYVTAVYGSSSRVYKFNLTSFTVESYIDTTSIIGASPCSSGVIDLVNGKMYWATESDWNDKQLLKYDLTTFTYDGYLSFSNLYGPYAQLLLDTTQGFLYIPAWGNSPYYGIALQKVRLSDFSVIDSLQSVTISWVGAAAYDSVSKIIYVSSDESLDISRILAINANTLGEITYLDINNSGASDRVLAFHSTFLYFGLQNPSYEGEVVKINTTTSLPISSILFLDEEPIILI